MSMKSLRTVVATTFVVCSIGTAFADAAQEARTHFEAIASGDVSSIMAPYAANAHFEWVGGPLNGVYDGKSKIRMVWEKFTKANAPLKAEVGKIDVSANPSGATATANVEFSGKAKIKVRYVLTYRGDKLTSEVWQIDPNLMIR